MKFETLFKGKKPLIGMIHTNSTRELTVLELAKKEIEIYLKYGIHPLIENYYGDVEDCEAVLAWMRKEHSNAVYGVNILGDYREAFRLAKRYGASFIQIDSICGHLTPEADGQYAQRLSELRLDVDVVLLGGVRFKYQAVRSGRSLNEDLRLGAGRCDAIVCTGEGTGIPTPFGKMAEFRSVLNDYPIIVGAGVTLETVRDTFDIADGAIVGSWFKEGHRDSGDVKEEYVKQLVDAISTPHDDNDEYETIKQRIKQMMDHGHLNMGSFSDDVDVKLWLPEMGGYNVTIFCDRLMERYREEGFVFLMTGKGDINCLSVLNIEEQSSGFKLFKQVEYDDGEMLIMEVGPQNIRQELRIPDNKWDGFVWGNRQQDAPIPSHPVSTSRYNNQYILNFSVSGEFNLNVYFLPKDEGNAVWVMGKSFCCK